MANADAQAPEIWRAEFGLDIFQTIVPAIAATLFEADAAGRQVEFIMDDEDFLRRNLLKIGQCCDRLAGTVHEGAGFQQPDVISARRLAIELGLWNERDFQLVGKMVDKPEADVMPGRFVLQSWVAQANDQTRWVHG